MVAFNKVVLAGNLTRNLELKFTKGGVPVCSFGLAVNRVRSKEDAADYFDVTAWRELGETIANYKTKGYPVLVEGRLRYSSWETNDAKKRSKVSIVAENVQFLGRSQNTGDRMTPGGVPAGGSPVARPGDEEDFDNIPF